VKERLKGEVLNRGRDDIIQFAELVSIARFDLEIAEGPPLVECVKGCLLDLLNEGLSVIGDLDESGPRLKVRPSLGSADSIVDRVIQEWHALGRPPNLAEICWIELTDKGRDVARERFGA